MGAGVVGLIGKLLSDDDEEDVIASSDDVEGSIGGKLDDGESVNATELVELVEAVEEDAVVALTGSLGPTVGGNGLGIGFSTGFVKPSFIS